MGFSEKLNIFWGMKFLGIFFGVITKLDYILGVISMHFRSFLKVKVQNRPRGYFLALLKFQIFFWDA